MFSLETPKTTVEGNTILFFKKSSVLFFNNTAFFEIVMTIMAVVEIMFQEAARFDHVIDCHDSFKNTVLLMRNELCWWRVESSA